MKTLNLTNSKITYADSVDVHSFSGEFAPRYSGRCAISGAWISAAIGSGRNLAAFLKVRLVRLEGWDKPRAVRADWFGLLEITDAAALQPPTVADKDDKGFFRNHGVARFSPSFDVDALIAHIDAGGKVEGYAKDGKKKIVSRTAEDTSSKPYRVGWMNAKSIKMVRRTLAAFVIVKRSPVETAVAVAAPVVIEAPVVDEGAIALDFMTDAFCANLEDAVDFVGDSEADIASAMFETADTIGMAMHRRATMIDAGTWMF